LIAKKEFVTRSVGTSVARRFITILVPPGGEQSPRPTKLKAKTTKRMSYITGTVVSYDFSGGVGVIKLDDPEESETGEPAVTEVKVARDSVVAESDLEKFLISSQRVSFKMIEQTPGVWTAFQVRTEQGDPIVHQWHKGTVRNFYFQTSSGTLQDMDNQESYKFGARYVLGSTKHILKAHCEFLVDDKRVLCVRGVDGKPFPVEAAKLAKLPDERQHRIKNRKKGEMYSDRYEIAAEKETDRDGWETPLVYRGKILFYHKQKGFGFVSPLDSTDQQDPANLYFRKRKIFHIYGSIFDCSLLY